MKRPLRLALVAAAAQYLTAFVGVGWGWAEVRHLDGIPSPGLGLGYLALLAIIIDWLRFLVTPRLRKGHPVALATLLALTCFLVWIMGYDPFDYAEDRQAIVRNILLLTPLLFAMGPLVRCGAWLGLGGTSLFFALAIAMMMHNGCFPGGFSCFFSRGID